MNKKFGTVLNCIDGRVQIPVINWMKENFALDYVDSITEPGVDKVLSQGEFADIDNLREKVMISINAHNSNVVGIVGHFNCAANPVSDLRHFYDIVKSTYVIKSWNLPIKVVGLWVDEYFYVHVIM